MIGTPFSYHAPASADEAARLLAESGAATEVIGGGTWVVPEMTHGKRIPQRVVDLRRAGLAGVREDDGKVAIGATTTYRDLLDSAIVTKRLPLLRTLALGITGGSQIWNRGTIGGSACYANPSSDIPASLVALRATLHLQSAAGVREVAAADFFLGAFSCDVAPGELLTSIVLEPAQRSGYCKFKLCESSWPIVTAAYARGADGSAHVVLGAAQATPLRVALADDRPETVQASVAAAVVDPWSDALAQGEYRKSIAPAIAKRAVAAASTESSDA